MESWDPHGILGSPCHHLVIMASWGPHGIAWSPRYCLVPTASWGPHGILGSPRHQLVLMASRGPHGIAWSPRYCLVPTASWGPHGIAWSSWHHGVPMAFWGPHGIAWSPRHRGVPMASPGPHGIMGSPWHFGVPTALPGPHGIMGVLGGPCGIGRSWTRGCLAGLMRKGTSLSLPGDGLVATAVSQWQGQGWGQGWGQSRSAGASWTETATNQGLGRSRCPVSRWRGRAGGTRAPGRPAGPWTPSHQRHCQPGGVSAPLRRAGASRGRAPGVYPRLSPFLLAQPWLQHKLSFVPLPCERCQPSPVPQDTSPCFSQPHALAETALFLSVN